MAMQADLPIRLRPAALTTAVAVAIALWAYWPTLSEMAWRWGHDPQYSHGYLVPGFALFLLWARRQRLQSSELRPAIWGLGLLGLAVGVRLAGAYFHVGYFDQVSLLPCLAGLLVLAGGRAALDWSWPAIAFLAFMVPLPYSLSLALSGPMQSFATLTSTFLLQTLGRPALAEGNVIQLNEIELGIVEACSGLRMLVVFFALSTAVALLIRKPLWEKALIAGSAIPIALASNVLRIVATGVLYEALGNGYGGDLFHDVAGWLMMPIGLAFLGLELAILRRLLLEPVDQRPAVGAARLQTVEVNPLAAYRGGNSSRRERRAVAVPAAAPAAPSQAPPALAPESVARS
jgi:exosortase